MVKGLEWEIQKWVEWVVRWENEQISIPHQQLPSSEPLGSAGFQLC